MRKVSLRRVIDLGLLDETKICLTSKSCWLSLDPNIFPELGNTTCENLEFKESTEVSLWPRISEPAVTFSESEII